METIEFLVSLSQPATMHPPATCSLFTPSGMGERIGKVKARKQNVGQDKDSAISEGQKRENKWCKDTISDKQTDTRPASRQRLLWWDYPPVFIAEPDLIQYRKTPWSVGVSCPSPASCPPPASSLWGQCEKEKAFMLCKHCTATAETRGCYQHCFSHRSTTQQRTSCREES